MAINDFEVIHARNAFEDWPEREQRRLLYRVWLELEPQRPLHPNLARYYADLRSAYGEHLGKLPSPRHAWARAPVEIPLRRVVAGLKPARFATDTNH